MRDAIKVYVVDYGKGRNLVMRYRDPTTGRYVCRTTGTRGRTKAERIAAKWEAELREGRYKPPSRVTWAEFRKRYEDEVLPGLASKTRLKIAGTFNAVEEILKPERLSSVTAERLSYFQSALRRPRTVAKIVRTVNGKRRTVRPERTIPGLAETTIKGHLAHLLAALGWAKRVGMLHDVPAMPRTKRARRSNVMKGRPITTEEFERMLGVVPKVVTSKDREWDDPDYDATVVASWRHFLHGLWWSGLRIAESLELYWDRDDKLRVDLSGRYPMLRIPAELEKGNRDRVLPIAPEFAEFLLATPDDARTGRVFDPLARRPLAVPRPLLPHRVGEVVTAIGIKAGVRVNGRKCASAHDLRRSFGERWAGRVMPHVLQQLMRHESIETTMRYYVGRNAETTAEALYRAVPVNTAGYTTSGEAPAKEEPVAETDASTTG